MRNLSILKKISANKGQKVTFTDLLNTQAFSERKQEPALPGSRDAAIGCTGIN